MKIFILACLSLITLCLSCTRDSGSTSHPEQAETQMEQPDKTGKGLFLEIIPSRFPFDTPLLEITEENPKIHVLLSNYSKDTIRMWCEWNSWGYFGLRFKVTYPNGKEVICQKKPQAWDRNFPDYLKISPNGHYVFCVDFNPKEWENSPLSYPAPKSQYYDYHFPIIIRAVYYIKKDLDAEKYKAWTGEIKSDKGCFIFLHY